MAYNKRNGENSTVRLSILEKQEIGNSLRIIIPSSVKGIEAPEWHYLPLSTICEIHPNYIIVDEWILRKKGIEYNDH
jgi:hypothetical protein